MAALALLVGEDVRAFLAAPAGLLFMLGSALSWAAGTVVLKASHWHLGLIARAAWMVALSAVPVLVLSLVWDRPWTLALPSTLVWATLAYHIVFPVAVCYAAWVTLVGRLPATVAAIGTLLIPLVGVGSAVILLGDPLTWQKVAALALVLASVVLSVGETASPLEPHARFRSAQDR
jgi:drug/metabolite transporter (DMT)-like permease